MSAPRPSVQPATSLSRLVSGFAARRGASHPSTSENARFHRRFGILLFLCYAAAAPLPAAVLPGAEPQASLIVNIFGQGLLEDLPILLAESSPVEQPAIVGVKASSVDLMLPRLKIRFGASPNLRRPENLTALGMFGMGVFLFILSWLIAAWERRPRTYRRPLFSDEPAPRPEPPHVIYSLTRNL